MKIFLVFVLLILCGACAHRNPLSDMSFQTIMAPPHVVASWYKVNTLGEPIRIYIEGNGSSENPTPENESIRDLAAEDPNSNVAYLGMPCQYLQVGCTAADWTTDLFSDKNVQSMEMAILSLMKKAETDQVILIGYLEGSQMAELIVQKYPELNVRLIPISAEDFDKQKIYEVNL